MRLGIRGSQVYERHTNRARTYAGDDGGGDGSDRGEA